MLGEFSCQGLMLGPVLDHVWGILKQNFNFKFVENNTIWFLEKEKFETQLLKFCLTFHTCHLFTRCTSV